MAVVTIKTGIEDMLEEAGALTFHYGVTGDRLKTAIGGIRPEYFHLPLPFGIG
jgi:hypothetical protein